MTRQREQGKKNTLMYVLTRKYYLFGKKNENDHRLDREEKGSLPRLALTG